MIVIYKEDESESASIYFKVLLASKGKKSLILSEQNCILELLLLSVTAILHSCDISNLFI